MTDTTTVVVQIGNSDDGLTQADWARFSNETDAVMRAHVDRLHFHGHSHGNAKWQNACWVAEIWLDKVSDLRASLAFLARVHRQDSIALTIGPTEFVEAR